MKKLIPIVCIIGILSSCTVLRKPSALSITVINYSKYTDTGFFITESNSVSFQYKPIGSLISAFQSGYEVRKNEQAPEQKAKWYNDPIETPKTTSVFIIATPEKSVDELVKKAKEIGVNGIINLLVVHHPSIDPLLPYDSYEATGMAISK